MSYKLQFRGQEVACDSPEEVVALVSLDSANVTPREQAKGGQRTIRSVVESLPAEQKQAVNLLDKAWPESTTDGKLRDEMQLSGNKKLAGILAGISKAAKKARINPIIKHESFRGGTGDRVHKYWLEEDVHAALKVEK
jgi:hypothetical protein